MTAFSGPDRDQLTLDVPMSESSGHDGRSDCTTCTLNDVDFRHRADCATRLDATRELAALAEATGIRYTALFDLWAHLTTVRAGGPLCAPGAGVVAVRLGTDLGWRPLIGQEPLPPRTPTGSVQPMGAVTVKPSEEYL